MEDERWVNASDIALLIQQEIDRRVRPLESEIQRLSDRLDKAGSALVDARQELNLPLMSF